MKLSVGYGSSDWRAQQNLWPSCPDVPGHGHDKHQLMFSKMFCIFRTYIYNIYIYILLYMFLFILAIDNIYIYIHIFIMSYIYILYIYPLYIYIYYIILCNISTYFYREISYNDLTSWRRWNDGIWDSSPELAMW